MSKDAGGRPQRIGAKLKQIRAALNLTQESMLGWLEVGDDVGRNYVSDLERGKRQPSPAVVAKYAELAGVQEEAIRDDELDLPPGLPRPDKAPGVPRGPRGRRKSGR